MRNAGKFSAMVFAAIFLQRWIGFGALVEAPDADVPHEEQVFELRILDGDSRGFVQSVEVWLRGREETQWKAAGNTTNGTLSLDISRIPDFELMVKAEEFSTYRSLKLHPPSLGDEMIIEMSRHPIVCARLIAPLPEMAGTFLIGPERQTPLYIGPPYNFADGSFEETGRFFIELDPAASAAIVVHNVGFACVPIAACFEGMEITLQPWQTVRGQLLKNGKPAPNEKVVATRVELPYASVQLAGENFTVETDTNGRFVFNQTVPFGRVTLVAFGQIQKTFAIREAKPSDIIFDCAGKEIHGSLTYTGPEQIDWSCGRAVLVGCHAAGEPQALDNLPDENDEDEWYVIETNSDGTFGAAMIPPGNYKLLLTCSVMENAVENESPHDVGQLLTFSGNICVGAGDMAEIYYVMLTKEEQPADGP